MVDIVDHATRSRMMSNIRSKNTSPELKVRKALHAAGLRFRIHSKRLPGRPDIVLPSRRIVVFVHGCFWHRHPSCRFAYTPKTRKSFWLAKFKANVDRDRRSRKSLQNLGWRVFTVWECTVNDTNLLRRLVSKIKKYKKVTFKQGLIPQSSAGRKS